MDEKDSSFDYAAITNNVAWRGPRLKSSRGEAKRSPSVDGRANLKEATTSWTGNSRLEWRYVRFFSSVFYVKFRFSKKTTKIDEISILDFLYVVNIKYKLEIS